MAPIKRGTAISMSMPMIIITIISSISVKPASCLRILLTESSAPNCLYQSEYLVPSSAVPVDLEYTSKTLCPP